MKSAAEQLAEARATRDAAKVAYDASLAQLRGDATAQSIGERVAARLSDDAKAAFHQALVVASESKGIIVGTIAALAMWFLRHPIIAWAEDHLGNQAEESDTDD